MNILNAGFFILNLRRDFIEALVVVVAFSILGYFISTPVELLLSEHAEGSLAYFSLQEVFITKIKLSVYTGIFLSVPVLILKTYKICFPVKRAGQFMVGGIVVCSAILLFFTGSFLCYFYLVPFGIKTLLGFGGEVILPHISLGAYIDFCVRMILLFGLCFELPLVMLAFAKMGVVTGELLVKMRRYAVLAAAVLSAFITPPDVISQVVVMVPLILLYEISIVVVRICGR